MNWKWKEKGGKGKSEVGNRMMGLDVLGAKRQKENSRYVICKKNLL